MKAGRILGLFILLIGVAMTAIGYPMYAGGGTLKALLFGPVFILMGGAMVIIPGSNYTNRDLRAKKINGNDVLYKASLKAKIIWIVAGLIGFIISTTYRESIAEYFI